MPLSASAERLMAEPPGEDMLMEDQFGLMGVVCMEPQAVVSPDNQILPHSEAAAERRDNSPPTSEMSIGKMNPRAPGWTKRLAVEFAPNFARKAYFVLDWLDFGRHNLHSNLAPRIAAYTHDQVLKLVKLLKTNPSTYKDDVEELDCFGSHKSMNVQNAILPHQLGTESEYGVAGIDSVVELTPLATARNVSPGLRRSGRLSAEDKGKKAAVLESEMESSDSDENKEERGERRSRNVVRFMRRQSSRSMLAPRVLVYAIDSDSHDDTAFEEFSVNEHDRLVEIDRRLREQEARDAELAQKIEEESKREADYQLEKDEELARKCQQELEDKAKEQVMRDSCLADMYQKQYDGRVTKEQVAKACETAGAGVAAEVGVQTSLNDFFPLHTAVCSGPVQGVETSIHDDEMCVKHEGNAHIVLSGLRRILREHFADWYIAEDGWKVSFGYSMNEPCEMDDSWIYLGHYCRNYNGLYLERQLGQFELAYLKKQFAYEVISMKGNNGELPSFMIEDVLF
ncbi:hypothetical protein ZWY2020_005208 [Hordeum vulgare]|nr:hypothetical protein ZWY2020_005208 [Hordeum vulgare]